MYEYCKKGTLEEVLMADKLKLDWTFKMALLRDVVKVNNDVIDVVKGVSVVRVL